MFLSNIYVLKIRLIGPKLNELKRKINWMRIPEILYCGTDGQFMLEITLSVKKEKAVKRNSLAS